MLQKLKNQKKVNVFNLIKKNIKMCKFIVFNDIFVAK